MLDKSPVLLRREVLNIALTKVDGNQLLRCFHVYVGMRAFVEELTFALDTVLGDSWGNHRQKSKSAPCCAARKMNASYSGEWNIPKWCLCWQYASVKSSKGIAL